MAYLVISYPELTQSDFDLIQTYRKENDPLYYNVVNPHFTIVFPVFNKSKDEFVSEVRKQLTGLSKFDFVLRCATINKDAFSDYFHLLLVPDEGYSRIVKLHDRLYSGDFKDNLRLDIDYIPHMGIGNSLDKFKCKEMVDFWNSQSFEIRGTIKKMDVIEYDSNSVMTIDEIELK